MLQACLNGSRTKADCRTLPVSATEIAEAAREAIAAGAGELHVHPKDGAGRDTMAPEAVARVVEQVRRAAPRVPVGVTTGSWTEPDPQARVALIRSWTVLPDHASVNWHEEGADSVTQALLERGVGVEAGLYSGTCAVRRFRSSPAAPRVLRVLAEVQDDDPESARESAFTLLREIERYTERPVLLHGQDGGAWTVLRMAHQRGVDTRIGLEDVLHTPQGEPAAGNAALVAGAVAMLRAG